MNLQKVLNITSILPVDILQHKARENDILLVTEDEINSRNKDISFKYIFVFPYANKILAKASLKWNSYYQLKQKEGFELKGRKLFLFPVFLIPKKVFFRNILTRLSVFLHRKRIDKLINNYQPTVIHAQDVDTGAYIARLLSKKYNIPYIVTLRGLNRVKDNKVKKNLEEAREIIAISATQERQVYKITNRKVNLIPHGISDSFFTHKKYILGNKLKFVFVGRLLKLKNIDKVIEALSLCKQDFIFDIYGEGAEHQYLKSLVVEKGLKGKVFFRGWIKHSELIDILPTYNLFIMPSYPETLGRVYFEAMASKLPVIATKGTGIDGIIVNGREGFLTEPNIDNIYKVLEQIFSHPNDLIEMSENAYKRALHYKWENIVKIYKNTYQKCLD